MEYIYGVLLLHSAGKEVKEDALTKVLEAAGVSVDSTRVKAVITSLEGVNIEDAVKATVATAPVGAAPVEGAAASSGSPKEKKKEEEEEEGPTEEEAMAGLGALFG